jgi:septum site-determining protein MinC
MTSDPSEKSSETIIPENDLNSTPDATLENSPEEELENQEDSSPDDLEEAEEEEIAIDPHLQPRFKTKDGRLLLILPSETKRKNGDPPTMNDWGDIWQALKHRLNAGDRFWQPNTPVYLMAQDRLLDVRQLQAIALALSEAKLSLSRVYTARRQTAVAASTAGYSVEQRTNLATFNPTKTPKGQALADPLYLESTIRSGVEIRHEGTVVIRGDVNPGGSVVADGDILVWGRLRGIVHAGARGNHQAAIMALEMEPTQIRIGDYVARSPESPPEFYPEVAYVSSEGIRIAGAMDFAKPSSP